MTEETEDPKFEHLRTLHFGGVQRAIAEDKFVSTKDLASLIRSRGDIEVPDDVLAYVCRHLAGEIRKSSGRPNYGEIETKKRNMMIAREYKRLLNVLRAGSLSTQDVGIYGTEDRSVVQDLTSAVRAARLVAGLFLSGAESWRSVQNIASSQK